MKKTGLAGLNPFANRTEEPQEIISEEAPDTFKGIPISRRVVQVPIEKLQENQNNEKYFPIAKDSSDYLKSLKQDIEKNGIHDPLIVTQRGTVLTGNRRLMLAKELGLKTLPVRYIEKDLSQEEEISLLVRDNVFRRSLKPEQRKNLIIELFGDLLLEDNRGKAKYISLAERESMSVVEKVKKTFKLDDATAKKDVQEARREFKTAAGIENTTQSKKLSQEDVQKKKKFEMKIEELETKIEECQIKITAYKMEKRKTEKKLKRLLQ